MDEIRSRARAALIGFAIGDALGAPVEFMNAREIEAKYGVLKEIVGGGWLRLKPGQVTDDTEMTLCVARAIVSANGWTLREIADRFAGWLKSKPVDVGDTCRKGIRNYMLHGALETSPNHWDAGNGALMRIPPVALFTLADERLLADCAVAQAHLTHNNPLSDAACIHYGRLLQLAIMGHSKNRLRRELEGLFAASPNFRIDHYRGLATGYVVDTMQTVLHYFFTNAGFEECLVKTVNQGGDADTTGALIGGLAGAYYGMEGIPRRWLRKMDRRLVAELAELSDRLLKLSPLEGSSSADS